MLSLINKPVKLDFYPISVEAQFQKNLKFQIAIFRSSTDDKGKRVLKIDKTQPMKFTNPHQKIILSNALSLLTTIPYDVQSKRYENKQIEFEMALEVDGNKSRLARKVNLRELIESKEKIRKFVMQEPSVVLVYKAQVKFEGQEKTENGKNQNVKKKIIRFDEGTKENERGQLKQKNNEGGGKTDRSSRHKTIASQMQGEHVQKSKQQTNKKEQKIGKSKSFTNNEVNADSNDYNRKLDNVSIESNMITQMSQDKIKMLNNLNSKLEAQKKQLEKKLKERDSKILQLLNQIEQNNKKNEIDLKSDKSTKDLLKKEKITLQKQISELKEQVKAYKKELQRLSKTAINYQLSSKNIAIGSEAEIKALKDRIRQLQKNQYQNNNQVQKHLNKLKEKQQIVVELKNKILVLEKDNLELRQCIKQCQKKLERQKEQYQVQLEELKDSLKELKSQNKNLKLPSSRDIKEDTFELKKKMQALEKQLERKEELLKKMTEIKKNNQQDTFQQNTALKKQVCQLKQTIDKLQSKRSQELSSTTSIQFRVQMQKMKKQLQLCKKNQKNLLIQKGKLQTSNKQLQEDMIKGKQTIVNMLNLVQQTANQKLISEAYSLMQ